MTPLAPGTELGPWTVGPVEPEKMKTFAVVLADPNPIHLDPQAVRSAELGDRVINQGPAGMGYVINMLRASVPDADLRELRIRFSANVFGGDHVTARGVVEGVDDVPAGRRALCRVWLDIDGGRRAIEGTATLIQPVG